MRRPEINSFVAMAPPANKYDFSFLAPCPASGLIVHGAQDTIVPPAAVASLAEKLAAQKRISIDHRSEEHTSELQSLMRISYAVFCLKKKIKINKHFLLC